VTLYVVRHAVAVAKNRWKGTDLMRPLTGKGQGQAAALTTWFDRPVHTVLSSPTLRCVASVLALAEHHGVELRTSTALAMGHPDHVVALARALLGDGPTDGGAVLCSHGEVIPGLLGSLGLVSSTHALDTCAKGSVWVIEHTGDGPAATYHPPAPVHAARR